MAENYVAQTRRAIYAHLEADGENMSDDMPGFMLEIFVPEEHVEDVDRNDTLRRDLTERIANAIAAFIAAGG